MLAGFFEALSAVWLNAPEVSGMALAGIFAALFLASAGAMWARRSLAAATVTGMLLLVDLAGIPFYAKHSWVDWSLQLGFGVIGLVGLAACIGVLRGGRRARVVAH